MPKFIKLKDEDGAEFAVNIEMITKIVPGADDELTEVFLVMRKTRSTCRRRWKRFWRR